MTVLNMEFFSGFGTPDPSLSTRPYIGRGLSIAYHHTLCLTTFFILFRLWSSVIVYYKVIREETGNKYKKRSNQFPYSRARLVRKRVKIFIENFEADFRTNY
jgi:hypothetical protein